MEGMLDGLGTAIVVLCLIAFVGGGGTCMCIQAVNDRVDVNIEWKAEAEGGGEDD